MRRLRSVPSCERVSNQRFFDPCEALRAQSNTPTGATNASPAIPGSGTAASAAAPAVIQPASGSAQRAGGGGGTGAGGQRGIFGIFGLAAETSVSRPIGGANATGTPSSGARRREPGGCTDTCSRTHHASMPVTAACMIPVCACILQCALAVPEIKGTFAVLKTKVPVRLLMGEPPWCL